jgi:HlyD family secretion protein
MTANVTIEASKKDDVLRVGNDALRFKPRGEGATSGGGDRTERVVGRLKTDLQLTAAQEKTLRDELKPLTAARGSAPGGTQADIADPAAMRQRMQAAVDQALMPLLTDEQRTLYEKSKKSRETTRAGNVYVLDEKGQPDRRFVRLGISDDQSTEIAGGQLEEGERVIVRARDPKK